jgi:hypothetical protein
LKPLNRNGLLATSGFPRKQLFSKVYTFLCSYFSPSNILLDVYGKLEGENIVGSAIKNTPNLWCFEEPSLSNAWPSPSDRLSVLPSTTVTPTTSSTGALLGDWREPILRMLRSQDVKINIRISDRFPSFSSGYSEPYKRSLLPDSSSIVGSLSPTPQSQPLRDIQIPGAYQGPQSPSFYKTARSTPLTRPSPAVELSPRSAVPLSPTPRPPPLLIPLPPPEKATPPQIPLPGTSSRAEPLDNTIISPWHDVSTRVPGPESFSAGDSAGDPPSQSTDPDSEDDASTITPTPERKKPKWHRRFLDRVVRRRSSQDAKRFYAESP